MQAGIVGGGHRGQVFGITAGDRKRKVKGTAGDGWGWQEAPNEI